MRKNPATPDHQANSQAPAARLEQSLVRTLLSPRAQEQYRHGAISKSELMPFAEAIRELSSCYVAHSRPSSISERQAAAYALYYLPINFVKLCFLIQKIPSTSSHAVPSPEQLPLRVLDYGCGPATGSLAALAMLPSKLDITILDTESAMRSQASKLLKDFDASAPEPKLARLQAVTTLQNTEAFDLIIAANVLNELEAKDVLPLLQELTSHLSKDGALLLLEPALPGPTRALMQARDSLLQLVPNLNPIFPCTHRNSCPMLKASPDDWCHGTLEGAVGTKEGMSIVSQLDEILGFNKHRIKYSACLFSRVQVPPQGYRAITDAKKTRRGIEITLCGNDFYGLSILPKSSFSDTNRELRRARSFDLLQVIPNASPSISEETTVSIVE